MSKIAIIMGSDSDLPVMKDCAVFLASLNIAFEIDIVSAHRTPEKMFEFAANARKNGFSVIVAGAGGSAHLPGMVAALTTLPVIGVPIKTASLSGLDSLYSIVQMPAGIPVATVAINGATNAGILAAQIISVSDEDMANKLDGYRAALKDQVAVKSAKLIGQGFEAYSDNFGK